MFGTKPKSSGHSDAGGPPAQQPRQSAPASSELPFPVHADVRSSDKAAGWNVDVDPARPTVDASFEQKVNILLVDDQPSNLLALEAVLSGLGQNFVKAQSGADCLRRLLDDEFAVILMDVKMPDMDGFETAALIRQRRRCQHTPIIFLTASEISDVQIFKGYSLGAVDYLCKPLVPQVLRAKVAVFVDIFQKSEQVRQQTELLRRIEQREHERHLAELKERWETARLREEMRLARQIQQNLFPAAPLPRVGFDIGGGSCPAEATGGDYFDYIPANDGGLGIVIADVSGHGYGPALLMAQMRAYLRAFMNTHADPAEVVSLLNRALAGDMPEDHFATLLLGRLDAQARSFDYISAGHTTGYVLTQSGTVKAQLTSTCLPLAVMPDAGVPAARSVILDPRDGVLLITDGIVEARSPDETVFGSERAIDAARASWSYSARNIVDSLFGAVRAFCAGNPPTDDMTAIVIKVGSSDRV